MSGQATGIGPSISPVAFNLHTYFTVILPSWFTNLFSAKNILFTPWIKNLCPVIKISSLTEDIYFIIQNQNSMASFNVISSLENTSEKRSRLPHFASNSDTAICHLPPVSFRLLSVFSFTASNQQLFFVWFASVAVDVSTPCHSPPCSVPRAARPASDPSFLADIFLPLQAVHFPNSPGAFPFPLLALYLLLLLPHSYMLLFRCRLGWLLNVLWKPIWASSPSGCVLVVGF